MEVRDTRSTDELARLWSAEARTADPGRRALLASWIQWADGRGSGEEMTWDAAVTVFKWGPLTMIGLPGEPFLATAETIIAGIPGPVMVTGYTNGCPGYFPTAPEYAFGGYEVEDAHRYYGLPAPFAPGTAEILARTAVELSGELT
jgi:hypothetical protein